jgi:hypothetical protein
LWSIMNIIKNALQVPRLIETRDDNTLIHDLLKREK